MTANSLARHCAAIGSIAASELQGLQFSPDLGLLSVWSFRISWLLKPCGFLFLKFQLTKRIKRWFKLKLPKYFTFFDITLFRHAPGLWVTVCDEFYTKK